ncbi:hypothetical protein F2Q68_00040949 [Brassica cretica]|uniref:Uncharacterized protein n=1 Tax=Brassica cretica TaxID=69181 RepID=A0A8S9MQ72_BRACR|nr:hypothetical protein F2Q68_00040949 [Brassica cretica]
MSTVGYIIVCLYATVAKNVFTLNSLGGDLTGIGPSCSAQSPGLLARPVSVAIPSGGAREAPDTSASSAGDRALNDEIDSSSHRSRLRVLEEINSVTPGPSSPRLSPLLRASGEEDEENEEENKEEGEQEQEDGGRKKKKVVTK